MSESGDTSPLVLFHVTKTIGLGTQCTASGISMIPPLVRSTAAPSRERVTAVSVLGPYRSERRALSPALTFRVLTSRDGGRFGADRLSACLLPQRDFCGAFTGKHSSRSLSERRHTPTGRRGYKTIRLMDAHNSHDRRNYYNPNQP